MSGRGGGLGCRNRERGPCRRGASNQKPAPNSIARAAMVRKSGRRRRFSHAGSCGPALDAAIAWRGLPRFGGGGRGRLNASSRPLGGGRLDGHVKGGVARVNGGSVPVMFVFSSALVSRGRSRSRPTPALGASHVPTATSAPRHRPRGTHRLGAMDPTPLIFAALSPPPPCPRRRDRDERFARDPGTRSPGGVDDPQLRSPMTWARHGGRRSDIRRVTRRTRPSPTGRRPRRPAPDGSAGRPGSGGPWRARCRDRRAGRGPTSPGCSSARRV